jgi:hypothetical protein
MRAQEISPAVSDARMRRLDGGDLTGIERHLLELNPVSRNCRFHSGFSDAAVAAYVRSLDVTQTFYSGQSRRPTAASSVWRKHVQPTPG